MITEENRRLHREKGEQTAKKLNVLQASSQLLHTSRALPKYGIKNTTGGTKVSTALPEPE